MSLDRIPSTAQKPSLVTVARARHDSASAIRQVEALEGVDADRERSLQQELAEIEAKAVGPFEGEERIQQDARKFARQISELGPKAVRLMQAGGWHGVDAKA